jgi:hypothetical protein
VFILAVVAMVTMLMPTSQASIQCYSCSGLSGLSTLVDSATLTNCGLPFRDNDAANLLPLVTCDGVCVTETHYNGGTASTSIVRSCSDVPIRDGCERMVQADSSVDWTCIKTCKTAKCNVGSDAASLVPVQLSLLLLLASVVAVTKYTLV